MISIKDFKVGETAYLLGVTGRPPRLRPVKIHKVGRKYVTTKEGCWERKYGVEHYSPDALVEKMEFGEKDLLFVSEQAYKDYTEKQELKQWLRSVAGGYPMPDFSLEQLRKVKAILEE